MPADRLELEARERKQDGLAVLAFLLSLSVMVLPLEADLLDVLLRQRRIALAGAVAAISFTVVFTPFALSWRRRRREPGAWKGAGFLIATAVILSLNALLISAVFIKQLSR